VGAGPALEEGPVELVEGAARPVDDEDVAIAVAAAAALDRRPAGDREGAAVALVAGGGVVDGEVGLACADDGVREAVGARGAEVWMEEVAAAGVDGGDGGR
jgi:hypothetical protein